MTEILKLRSIDDSIRYFAKTLTAHSVKTGDLELGGIAIAMSATADRVQAELAELKQKLDTAERQNQELDRSIDQILGERDNYHDIADKLAYAVAPEEVIGEHSSMNCPWENALDLITPLAEVTRLRKENADYEKALGLNEGAAA